MFFLFFGMSGLTVVDGCGIGNWSLTFVSSGSHCWESLVELGQRSGIQSKLVRSMRTLVAVHTKTAERDFDNFTCRAIRFPFTNNT
jgi:hypothetical protein